MEHAVLTATNWSDVRGDASVDDNDFFARVRVNGQTSKDTEAMSEVKLLRKLA